MKVRRDAHVITLGCRLNAYESDLMRGEARRVGLRDAVIVNTCAVTREAVRQSRQSLRRARRARPDARLIATGCAAQIEPETFAQMPEVDVVLGNQEKLALAHLHPAERVQVGNMQNAQIRIVPPSHQPRARAVLRIQDGCDHHCTFCVIPQGRGQARSLPPADAAQLAQRLCADGHGEIILTGVDLASYGRDLDGDIRLGDAVRAILNGAPNLRRLRLSSLDPAALDPVLLACIAHEPRVQPHLHLSVQAGDNLVLKRMRRRHLREDVIALCAELQEVRPDIAFGADFIAGFPTETDAMFENTCALIKACGFVYIHAFPFSPRPGTPAARMPQTPTAVARARAARLRALGQDALWAHLAGWVGREGDVFVETPTTGRLPDFTPVRLQGATPNTCARLRITDTQEGALIAQTC